MPWWIWLALALLMLASLIGGAVYAFLRAKAAFSGISALGAKFTALVPALEIGGPVQDAPQEGDGRGPVITQPLSVARDRYADAHAEVIERREASRRRHMRRWERWSSFNS